ncbi:MAG: hypothetical protein DRI97_18705 [Bacteroidetes bacterium]|nr:MAG: hypothetical protein DRI97_18705 [Bacteroidota bacterium]
MVDFEKDFYANLGLLSVRFAKMEFKLTVILGKLIGADEELIPMLLTENLTLYRKLELIRKINKVRTHRESLMETLYAQVEDIRIHRNSFIHGVWGDPYEKDNDVFIECKVIKIKYEESEFPKQRLVKKRWTKSKTTTYRLTFIRTLITKLDDVIMSQDALISELENKQF